METLRLEEGANGGEEGQRSGEPTAGLIQNSPETKAVGGDESGKTELAYGLHWDGRLVRMCSIASGMTVFPWALSFAAKNLSYSRFAYPSSFQIRILLSCWRLRHRLILLFRKMSPWRLNPSPSRNQNPACGIWLKPNHDSSSSSSSSNSRRPRR